MALTIFTAGCGSTILYDAAKDEEATKAKTELAKVDLDVFAATRRERLGRLRQSELDTVDKIALLSGKDSFVSLVGEARTDCGLFNLYKDSTTARGNELCSVLGHGSFDVLRTRLSELGISRVGQVRMLSKAIASARLIFAVAAHKPFEDLRPILRGRTPTCEDFRHLRSDAARDELQNSLIGSVPEKQRVRVRTSLKSLVKGCSLQTRNFDVFVDAMLTTSSGGNPMRRDTACKARATGLGEIVAALCDLWRLNDEVVSAKAAAAEVATQLKRLSSSLSDLSRVSR